MKRIFLLFQFGVGDIDITTGIILLVLILGLFFIIREFLTWYWKIDEIIWLLKVQNKYLSKLSGLQYDEEDDDDKENYYEDDDEKESKEA